ncbi:MAG: hypothetical protein V4489_06255 [Chlamydiota bacterium]
MINNVNPQHTYISLKTNFPSAPLISKNLAIASFFLPRKSLEFFDKRDIKNIKLRELKLEYTRRDLMFFIDKLMLTIKMTFRKAVLKNMTKDTQSSLRKKYLTRRKKYKNLKKALTERKTTLAPKAPSVPGDLKDTGKKIEAVFASISA